MNTNALEEKVFRFIVKLRSENSFDSGLFNLIYENITAEKGGWIETKSVPLQSFIGLMNLLDTLAGDNRFLNEKDSVLLEDAHDKVSELLIELELEAT